MTDKEKIAALEARVDELVALLNRMLVNTGSAEQRFMLSEMDHLPLS